MGCKNTKQVSLPVTLEDPKPFLLTPSVMRRNLKTEVLRNNTKLRKVKDEIAQKQADLYELKANNGLPNQI